MRAQRQAPVTVQLNQITTVRDKIGGSTADDPVQTIVRGALFSPATITERTDPNQAPVVEPAVFNAPGVYQLDVDDLVEVVTLDDEGAVAAVLETWQVVGGSAVWLDRTKIPVTRASGGVDS